MACFVLAEYCKDDFSKVGWTTLGWGVWAGAPAAHAPLCNPIKFFEAYFY